MFIHSFVIFMILFFVSFLKEEILGDKRGIKGRKNWEEKRGERREE
ncbi:hypothetical protein BCD_1017 (plasmid) [Borrelia crocidurae DOU]|uniref:Uncharacterized protein n=1 Tax=Borrelia crocidurae DOU TaxID=1293575 RepID=W5SKA2_9SPIR|nr:hypothetical protein BCD_1017 [Borrelia crocidurae DOU]